MSAVRMERAAGENAPADGPNNRGNVIAFLADAESEDVVRQSLTDLLYPNSEVKRGGIDKAIQHLTTERSPSILIVDVSKVEMPVGEMNRLAEVCEPGVHVIAVGDRNDIGLYRNLMQAGVTDYFTKPLTRELVQRALRRITDGVETSRISERLGKVVTFMGARGGVGASTLATNLAWVLANKQGRRVALLDLDLQHGDCGLMLDVKPTAGLREALESPHRVDALFVERAMSKCGERLFVLSVEEGVEEEIHPAHQALESLLTILRAQFHYVVVDVPRTSMARYRQLLDMAALRIVVADQTLRSARDAARLRTAFGPDSSDAKTLLVLNRAGEHGKAAVPEGDFTKAVGLSPTVTVPYDPKRIALAAAVGKAAAENGSAITRAALDLANELSGQGGGKAKNLLKRFFK